MLKFSFKLTSTIFYGLTKFNHIQAREIEGLSRKNVIAKRKSEPDRWLGGLGVIPQTGTLPVRS